MTIGDAISLLVGGWIGGVMVGEAARLVKRFFSDWWG